MQRRAEVGPEGKEHRKRNHANQNLARVSSEDTIQYIISSSICGRLGTFERSASSIKTWLLGGETGFTVLPPSIIIRDLHRHFPQLPKSGKGCRSWASPIPAPIKT